MIELNELRNQLEKYKVVDLERRSRDFNFSDVIEYIMEMIRYIDMIDEIFWSRLPQNRKNHLITHINEFLSLLEKISNFDPKAINNPSGEREQIAQNVDNVYNGIYEQLIEPFDSYSSSKNIINSDLKSLSEKSKKVLESLNSKSEEADMVLASMKEGVVNKGTTQFKNVFQNQANIHKKLAICFGFVISIVLVIVYFGLIFFMSQLQGLHLESLIKSDLLLFFKIFLTPGLLIALGGIIIFQFVKNFNSHMNLYALNKHKQNSLDILPQLYNAPLTDLAKDQVLLQATKAIFELGSTGFVNTKEEHNSTFEVMNRLADSKA